MIVTTEILVKTDFSSVFHKVSSDKLGKVASLEWYRLTFPYMPRRDGSLSENVKIEPWEFTHNMPYSARQYTGIHFNFRTDKNPKAGPEWDKRAIQEKQDEMLASAMQRWVNKNI